MVDYYEEASHPARPRPPHGGKNQERSHWARQLDSRSKALSELQQDAKWLDRGRSISAFVVLVAGIVMWLLAFWTPAAADVSKRQCDINLVGAIWLIAGGILAICEYRINSDAALVTRNITQAQITDRIRLLELLRQNVRRINLQYVIATSIARVVVHTQNPPALISESRDLIARREAVALARYHADCATDVFYHLAELTTLGVLPDAQLQTVLDAGVTTPADIYEVQIGLGRIIRQARGYMQNTYP
jgi:hypothetical protein